QHREISELFDKVAEGHSGVLGELADLLSAHMSVEQELFYPAVRKLAPEDVLTSFEEHALAELALKRLLATDEDELPFAARLEVLRDAFEAHVEQEQEELFPLVDKSLPRGTLIALGKQMEVRFGEARERGHEALLPEGYELTSADIAADLEAARAQPDEREDD